MALMFRNWVGELVEAPEDLATSVARACDGYIVWSTDGFSHRVRYGLQAKEFRSTARALREFDSCLRHYLGVKEGC